MFVKSSLSFTILKFKKGIGRIQTSFLGLKTRHYPSPWIYCQIRYVALRVLQSSKGFWVFLIWVGAGLTQITMFEHARPAWQKQNWERRRKSRCWVEFLSREGDRHCFILASDKNKKEQKNLLIELVDYSPKQDDHKQRILEDSK